MNLYESIKTNEKSHNLNESDNYKRRITLTNDSNIALSPANIVDTRADGTRGCHVYLENLISNCNTAEELAKKLNDNKFPTSGDKRIFGDWHPVSTETDVTKRVCTNMMLNQFDTIKYNKIITVDSNSDGHQILKLYKDGVSVEE